jgi:hypothetical protein
LSNSLYLLYGINPRVLQVKNYFIRTENSSTAQFCDIIGPMTPEDIENMQAGREMDILIIRAVFGLEPQSCMVGGHPPDCTGNVSYPKYSTDIAAAWLVVEKLREVTPLGDIHLERWDNRWAVSTCFDRASGGWDGFTYGDTAPLAICRAALLAVINETPAPQPPTWEGTIGDFALMWAKPKKAPQPEEPQPLAENPKEA